MAVFYATVDSLGIGILSRTPMVIVSTLRLLDTPDRPVQNDIRVV